MRIFSYIYIYLISLYPCTSINARSAYENSHLVEREENVPNLHPSYSKRKLLKDELGQRDDSSELMENQNSLYDAPRFQQYNPGDDLYARQAPRMIQRSNIDNNMYNVKKRDYYPDMKTARDASLEVVLDPKTRKAVALIDNPAAQESYDLQGWKNSKDDNYGYDAEQYSQGNQDQVVNLIYPVSRMDRMSIRNSMEDPQTMKQNKNLRNIQDCDNQDQLVYKAAINEPERSSQKIKRHIKTDNKETNEMHNSKDETPESDVSEVKERKAETNIPQESSDDVDMDQSKQHNNDNKRSIPSWTNEQITTLKKSLTMFQENDAEYENLRNVLNDMGLVENSAVKRETNNMEDDTDLVQKEDENLNLNNIVMKKNDKKWETNAGETAQENLNKRELHEKNKIELNKQIKKRSDKLVYKKNLKQNGDANQNNNINKNDESERKKRDADTNVNNPDIMKGLEKSGELSVSGNKSPLASDEKSETDTMRNERSRIIEQKQPMNKRNANDIDEDYEQKIETEIQAKIDAIKEKVKREIMMQKQKQYSYSRKKRETLLDSENKNINPDLVANEELQPHIRTRRKTEENITTEENDINLSKINQDQVKNIQPDEIQHHRSRRDTTNQNEKLQEASEFSDVQVARKQINPSNINKEIINNQNQNNDNDDTDQSDMKKRKSPQEDSSDTLDLPSAKQNKILRKKRANNVLPENKMIFRPYLSPQDEEEGEEGEFDNSYDQTYIDKREIYEPDYQYFENKDAQPNQEYQPDKAPNYIGTSSEEQRYRRSGGNSGNFKQPMSRNSRKYFRFNRNKRDNENSQLHGGGMLSSRKSALKIKAEPEDIDKRDNAHGNSEDDSDNSENDFFGPLSQNYQEGELNRYKRVKRENKLKKFT